MLASTKGHGLKHLSRASAVVRRDRRGAAASRATETAATPSGSVDLLDDPVGTMAALARGRDQDARLGWSEDDVLGRLQELVAQARRGWTEPLPEAELDEWGWASYAARLDSFALKKAKLLQSGALRGATLKWGGCASGVVDHLMAAFDLRDPDTAFMVSLAVDGRWSYRQQVDLTGFSGRWYFVCPVEGRRVRYLFLREGRLASMKAQRLVAGLHRPKPPKGSFINPDATEDDIWKPR